MYYILLEAKASEKRLCVSPSLSKTCEIDQFSNFHLFTSKRCIDPKPHCKFPPCHFFVVYHSRLSVHFYSSLDLSLTVSLSLFVSLYYSFSPVSLPVFFFYSCISLSICYTLSNCLSISNSVGICLTIS